MNRLLIESKNTLWWILGLAVLLLFTGIGLRDPWPADEPRFAQVAREMVHSGQWLFPTRGGEYYSDKPPIFMWAIAAFYWLTNNMRLAFLLPSALCSIGTVWLVYDLARRLWDVKVATYASLMLLATFQFVLQAKAAQIDAMVTCWITLSCYGLIRHLILGNARYWYFLSWFFMGIGVITKGVGFLPIFLFIPWALMLRERGREKLAKPSLSLLAGTPFFCLAIALWLVPMVTAVSFSDDPSLTAYRNDILFRQTGTRYANPWHHVEPFYYYVFSVIPVFWLPTVLLLPGLVVPWAKAIRALEPRVILPLAWVLLVLVFFSASPGKRGVYILPMLPMFCLAAAPYVEHILTQRWISWCVRSLLILLVVVFIGIAIAAYAGNARLLEAELDHGISPWNLLLVVGLFALLAAFTCRRRQVDIAWAMFIIPFWLLYSTWGYTIANSGRTPANVMSAVDDLTDEHARIGLVNFREQYLLFSKRAVTHFGYHTPTQSELSESWSWLAEDGNRFLLLSDSMPLECFNQNLAQPVGRAHGHDWRLYPASARQASCQAPEVKVTRFDYWQRGALR